MHRPPPDYSSGMDGPIKSQSTPVAFCLNVIHNLTQLCLGGVIVHALILPNISTLSESFAQHVILCTCGYFILMAQAILSFSPVGWASNMSYENKKIIHFTMQLLGSILAITGSIIRMADSQSNFNSGHAICGFIALVLTVVSLLGGILAFIFPQQLNNKVMKILHACVGAITMSFAFIALVFAFQNYYKSSLGMRNADIAIVLTMFSLVGLLLMATIKNVNRVIGK